MTLSSFPDQGHVTLSWEETYTSAIWIKRKMLAYISAWHQTLLEPSSAERPVCTLHVSRAPLKSSYLSILKQFLKYNNWDLLLSGERQIIGIFNTLWGKGETFAKCKISLIWGRIFQKNDVISLTVVAKCMSITIIYSCILWTFDIQDKYIAITTVQSFYCPALL